VSLSLAHQNKARSNKTLTPAKTSSTPYQINTSDRNSRDLILQLQQTIGNQAVLRLMRSSVMFDFGKIGIQQKLKVSQPGDEYEQEADRVAEKIVSMTNDNPIASTLSHKVEKIDRKCATCEMKEKEKKEEKLKISRKPSNTSILEESDEFSNETNNIRPDSGIPLDRNTRVFMESRFGHDFSKVRIHADEKAARSAQSVNALAYTIGNDIVFEGQHLPESESGRKLLAHELTHVLQQRNGDLRIARAPEDEADAGVPDVKPVPRSTTTPVPKTVPPAPAQVPNVSSGGHTVAPPGVAPCPDPPQPLPVLVDCPFTPSAPPAPPLAKETAVIPAPFGPPYPGRFGGDPALTTFAKKLAQCRADRTAKGEIEKRYNAERDVAKKKAIAESNEETKAAVAAAKALKTSIYKARKEAKQAAEKKKKDAQAAVIHQKVPTVTAELATKYEDDLAKYYDKIIGVGFERYKESWTNTMKKNQNQAKQRITMEKGTKPKGAKGVTTPTKTADQIAAEVEAEMVQIRCKQMGFAYNRLEWLKHGWAVKSREKVDFDTLASWGKFLGKDFAPTYEIHEPELVEIPRPVKGQEKKPMPGIAREFAAFLTQLDDDPATPAFTAKNYRGHGSKGFVNKGFSVDLYLDDSNLDPRGFYPVPLAVKFLLTLNKTANSFQPPARWRVLYNDFRVADQVNKETGLRSVGFVDWHGPLVLHMHLDIEIPKDPALHPTPPAAPGVTSPPAPGVTPAP
jgi:hypothetical protein